MNNNIKEALNNFYNHGFSNSSELITTLLRVKTTKKAVAVTDSDEQIFQAMKEKTEEALGYFPGDEKLFTEFYHHLEAVDIFEILGVLSSDRSVSEYGLQIPHVLMKWFERKLENKNCHSVLVPEAEHYLSGICEVARKYTDKVFTITTRQAPLYELLSLAYENFDNVEVVHADIYDVGFPEDKYDFIFSVPAFGGRNMVSEGNFICRELDLVATENLLKRLSDSGTLFIVLPAKISFGGGQIAQLRTFIEENYCITEINEMPQGLFRPYAGVKTYLFEFTVGETQTVRISSYDGKYVPKVGTSEMDCVKQRTISKAELDELGDWRVEILLADKNESMERYANSSTQKVRLGDVAEVFRGKAVQKKDSDGNIAIVNISNISEAGIDYYNLDCFEEEKRKIKRYELQTDDVLVTSRGTAIRAAVFVEQDKTCIASANLTVIRPGKQLRGKYLRVFLESPVGITLLKSFQRGTAIININHSDIMELSIPLPPMEQQEKIVARYEEEQKTYQDSIEAAQSRWNKAKSDLYQEIY